MNTKIQIPTATARTFFIEMSDSDKGHHSLIEFSHSGEQFEYEILADFLTDDDIREFAKAFTYAAEQLS